MNLAKKTATLLLLCSMSLSAFIGCDDTVQWDGPERDYTSYDTVERVTLPVISIRTADGKPITSKTEYSKMAISVEGVNPFHAENVESEGYNLENAPGKIRGRGNSSWDLLDKKSYRIKLGQEAQLLGLGDGADKDYTLLANAREKTFVRNWAMLRFGEMLGFSYNIDSTFVSLYLNGEYLGVYQLCEQNETGDSRVQLDSTAQDGEITVCPSTENLTEEEAEKLITEFQELSFYVELDKRAKSEGDLNLDYFNVRDYEIPFAVKSDVHTVAEVLRIKDYMETVDAAILSGDREAVERYVDLSSFVDMYLLEEFSKDRDVNYASLYFCKPQNGLLQCTAPWDFDLALGNDSGDDTGEDHQSPVGVMVCRNRWFEALYETEWFRQLLSDRWQEISPMIETLIDETVTLAYSLQDAAAENFIRWPILGKQMYHEPDLLASFTDYLSHVWYLGDWMQDRREWMDGFYILSDGTSVAVSES